MFFSALFVISILAHLLGNINAQDPSCSPGTFVSGSRCVKCPPGTFSDRSNARECTACIAGTYNPFSGAQGSDVCRRCPRNTTGSEVGGTSLAACTPCPPGKVSDGFTFRCRNCPPGTATPGSADVCVKCDEGEYQLGNECLKCPDGTTAAEGSAGIAACKPCPPLSILQFGRRCELCRAGRVFERESQSCRKCPVGFFGRSGDSECTPCAPGTVSSFSGAGECVACKPGFVAKGSAASLCRREVAGCPPRFFAKKNGDCIFCGTGSILNKETETCENCPPGSSGEGGVSTKCQRCPNGTVVSDDGRSCLCDSGTEMVRGKCVKCSPGTFKKVENFEDFERPCEECPGGTFAKRRGATECLACPEGTVSENRSARCKRCAKGLVISTLRQFDVPDRCAVPSTNCPPGFSRARTQFRNVICRADSCPNDSFLRRDGRCESCKPGEFPRGQPGCRPCPITSTSVGGAARCTRCPNGLVRNEMNPAECICSGPSAKGRKLTKRGCVKCRPGTFNSGEDPGDAKCKPCDPGTRVPFAGADQCFDCAQNEFVPAEGMTACMPCPEGTGSYGLGDTACFPL